MQTINDLKSDTIHSHLSAHLESKGAQIEDWKDEARLIGKWLVLQGARSWITAKEPKPTQLGTYMHMVEFVDADGEKRWLGFDGDSCIANVSNTQPVPANWS